jgi:hypothetical protein
MISPPPPADPSRAALDSVLGCAVTVWDALHASIARVYPPVTVEWKASKSDYGRLCVLRRKKRTIVYLTPEAGAVRVAVVLGERAAQRALESTLPEEIRILIRDARPYAEGRGIRFAVSVLGDLPVVMELLEMKMH